MFRVRIELPSPLSRFLQARRLVTLPNVFTCRFGKVNMPDERSHRGAHPEDAVLFSKSMEPNLKNSVQDLRWLYDRGYAVISSVKLVGDRYGLTVRQRTAVTRATCSTASRSVRSAKEISLTQVAHRGLFVDGYNLLTTVEAALAGGVILSCQDGCFRDMASMHGTWKRVEETLPALELVGRSFESWQVAKCHWLLDSPVSNSGRLKGIISEIAARYGWNWTVELVPDPDRILSATPEIVVTADSMILDACTQWANVAPAIIRQHISSAWYVNLSSTSQVMPGIE